MTWRYTRLKFLAEIPIRNGLGEAGDQNESSWPRYIRTTDIEGPRQLRENNCASLPPDIAVEAVVHRNDLLMSAAGTVGKTLLYLFDEPACYAGYLVRFRPRAGTDARFVAYWTETPLFLDQVEIGKVRSTIDNFSGGKYQNMRIRIPDAVSQQRIADYLDAETARIDALIDKKRRMVGLVVERVRAVISELTEDRRGARVRHLTSLRTSGPRGWGELVGLHGSPFIRSANLRRDSIDVKTDNVAQVVAPATDEAKRSSLREGDVVVGITGANTGWVGCVPEPLAGGFVSQHVAILRPSAVEPRWLAYSLYSTRLQDQLLSGQYGGTKQQLGLDDLAELRVGLPDRDEQRRRNALMASAECRAADLIERLNTQIGLLAERRQALITAAVTGELGIPAVAA